MSKRRILVIAGSDSSGGAGLEADQKVIAAHGCYAMTATTALTAQSTLGVDDIHITPSTFVQKQLNACFEDIGVDVVKTGMLACADTVKVVAHTLKSQSQIPLCVVDPVMVSTSGSQLLPEDAVKTLRELLLPLATVLTPNLEEAKLLLKDAALPVPEVHQVEDLKAIANSLTKLGPKYVLLKGGHMPLTKTRRAPTAEDAQKHVVVDILASGDGPTVEIDADYIESKHTHGTGCCLASAIASNLARGMEMLDAVRAASHYVAAGIKLAPGLGKGNGPIGHFHSTYKLPFTPGHFLDYVLERPDVKEHWHRHTHHPFVQQLADGSLPLEKFKYYLIQDYLYLIQFSRANALAAYKAQTVEDITASASIVTHIQFEMQMHIEFCEGFGINKDQLEQYEESQACTAYTRYMLEVGNSEDWLALQVSLAPCLLGYGMIAERLYNDPATKREGNHYFKWIEQYVSADFKEAMRKGRELLEKHAVRQSPHRVEELVRIFIHATKMEIGFWEMGSGGSTS